MSAVTTQTKESEALDKKIKEQEKKQLLATLEMLHDGQQLMSREHDLLELIGHAQKLASRLVELKKALNDLISLQGELAKLCKMHNHVFEELKQTESEMIGFIKLEKYSKQEVARGEKTAMYHSSLHKVLTDIRTEIEINGKQLLDVRLKFGRTEYIIKQINGIQGQLAEINKIFKNRLSEMDTEVKGELDLIEAAFGKGQ